MCIRDSHRPRRLQHRGGVAGAGGDGNHQDSAAVTRHEDRGHAVAARGTIVCHEGQGAGDAGPEDVREGGGAHHAARGPGLQASGAGEGGSAIGVSVH
eukprot:349184-Pyramimonas_sp.AAC.1